MIAVGAVLLGGLFLKLFRNSPNEKIEVVIEGPGAVDIDSAVEREEAAESTEVISEQGESAGEPEETEGEQVATAFSTIEDGKLRMVTNAEFPPYEMIADNGLYEGIDVDLAELIAESFGLELVIDDVPFDSVLSCVREGKADIVVSGITPTEERKQYVDFTDPYVNNEQVMIVSANSDIQSAADLYGGKTVGVQVGSAGEFYAHDDIGIDNVMSFPDGPMAVEAILSGGIDAVIIDREQADTLVKTYDDRFKILETEYPSETYAIGVSKDNPALYDAVNRTLGELMEDGMVKQIIDKYNSAAREGN